MQFHFRQGYRQCRAAQQLGAQAHLAALDLHLLYLHLLALFFGLGLLFFFGLVRALLGDEAFDIVQYSAQVAVAQAYFVGQSRLQYGDFLDFDGVGEQAGGTQGDEDAAQAEGLVGFIALRVTHLELVQQQFALQWRELHFIDAHLALGDRAAHLFHRTLQDIINEDYAEHQEQHDEER